MAEYKDTTFKEIKPGELFMENPVDHAGASVFLKIRGKGIQQKNGAMVTAIQMVDGMPTLFRDTDFVVRLRYTR